MKFMKVLCAGAMALALGACSTGSTSAASSAASEDETAERVTTEYSEEFDESVGYKSETFKNMTYDMVSGWAPRFLSKDDGWTYLAKGQKDSVEVHFVEGGNDMDTMKAFVESEDMSTYCKAVVSTEEKEIAGKEGLYVQAITVVTATIMADANKDFYMIPADNGFYFISFTFDPLGSIDYSKAYEHIVNSVTIA